MQELKSIIKTIQMDAPPDIIEFEPEFSAICSIGKRPFWGKIKIKYRPMKGTILEFVSVEEWINSLANEVLTIEDLARLAFNEVSRVLGDIPLQIEVFARTTVHAPASATISRRWESEN